MVLPQIQAPPERRRVFMEKLYQICCPKCITKRIFIVMGKTHMENRNTCVSAAGFNRRQNQAERLDAPKRQNIPLVLSAEKPLSCTMTRNITATTAAVTRSVTIFCLCQSLPLSRLRPCQSCSVRRISSGCAFLSMFSLWH